jgi:hypothetical protein
MEKPQDPGHGDGGIGNDQEVAPQLPRGRERLPHQQGSGAAQEGLFAVARVVQERQVGRFGRLEGSDRRDNALGIAFDPPTRAASSARRYPTALFLPGRGGRIQARDHDLGDADRLVGVNQPVRTCGRS